MKNRTNTRNSFGEKLNVGMCTWMYGRTPFRFWPHCGNNRPPRMSVAAVVLAAGEFGVETAGDAEGDDAGLGAPLLAAGVDEGTNGFSSGFINEGSFRNFISQSGSTRAPSLVSIGGRNSLAFA